MKRNPDIRFRLMFVAAMFAMPAWASTIQVPAAYPTIQAAINAAATGDTIEIADGTYNENVNINKALTLVSVNGCDHVTIQGSAAQAAALAGNLGTVCVSANNVKIGTNSANGLTIRGYDWTSPGIEHSAVYLKNTATTGLAIIGNHLVADGESALLAEYGSTQGIEVAHNLFSGKTYVGDTIGGNSSVQYTVPNVPRSMIYFGGAGRNISFHDNTVTGSVGGVINGTSNTYYNTGATIDCTGAPAGQGASVSNNTFTVPSWAALRARGSNSVVTNNTFDSSACSPLVVGTYYEQTASGTYTGNRYLSGTGTTTLGGDGSSAVVLPGNRASYVLAKVTTPSGSSYRAIGPDRTVYMVNQAAAVFDDQTVTLAALTLPVIRPVPAGYSTIQAAINAALDNEIVEVAAGVYPEQLSISKPLTVTGADGAVLDGSTLTTTWTTGVKIRCGNVTFNNIDVRNYTQDGITAYKNIDMPNLHITNCKISNIQPGNWGFGIYVGYESEGWLYTPPRLTNHLDFTGLLIEGNEITNVHSSALVVQAVTGTPGTLIVRNNNIHDNSTNSGIWIDCARNVTIENNTVNHNKWGIEFSAIPEAYTYPSYDPNTPNLLDGPYSAKDIVIRGNDITNNTFQGIALYEAWPSTFTIANNRITGNGTGLDNQLAASVAATPNYWGSEDGPVSPANTVAGLVTYSPWWVDSAMSALRYGISGDIVIDDTQTYTDLYIAPGSTVIVGAGGTLNADQLELAPGAVLEVHGGTLVVNGSTISGEFTFFNSFGSVEFNGDVNITGSAEGLILVSDVHVADGATITVDGTLVVDGCVIDCQTPGGSYVIDVNAGATFTMARTVVIDGDITLGSGTSRLYDNRFTASTVTVESGTAGARVYHNLCADGGWLTDLGTGTVTSVSNWGNVSAAADTQDNLWLDLDLGSLDGRTKDAEGNVWIQPGDPFTARVNVSVLQAKVAAAEVMLGYSTAMLSASGLLLEPDWNEMLPGGFSEGLPGVIGKIDAAFGISLEFSDPEGSMDDQTLATVNLAALAGEGQTVFFHRVKLPGDVFPGDTRLTTGGLSPAYLAPFTSNSGTVTIDGTAPVVDTAAPDATQVQANSPAPVDVMDPDPAAPPAFVFRNGRPVVITLRAADTGSGIAVSGLDSADAEADLWLQADNGTTVLSSWTASATDDAGVVTYTVTLDIPADSTTGTYAVSAKVRDRSGNWSDTVTLGAIKIANEVLATVELEGYAGSNRQVVFTATDSAGAVLGSWIKNVAFAGYSTASVPLEDVPADTVAISAKTAWNLRSKLTVAFSEQGLAAADFIGPDRLPAGDLNGDNLVNTLDYSILRFCWLKPAPDCQPADITGDGIVNLTDYALLRTRFYSAGDSL